MIDAGRRYWIQDSFLFNYIGYNIKRLIYKKRQDLNNYGL